MFSYSMFTGCLIIASVRSNMAPTLYVLTRYMYILMDTLLLNRNSCNEAERTFYTSWLQLCLY